MYSHCIACSRSLGTNDVVEVFPVGRRLAFDAAKGRLWVVCPDCRRWNLTPLDERWEAIEACERSFRDTRTRVSTEQIGLAKLREGLELIRVGAPLRPELAAWRYGPTFANRRRRQLVAAGAILGGAGLLVAGGMSVGIGIVTAWSLGRSVWRVVHNENGESTVARVLDDRGDLLRVRRRHLARTTIVPDADGQPTVSMLHETGRTIFTGASARRVATALLPNVNRFAGTADEIEYAVGRLERAGGAERFLTTFGAHTARLTRVEHRRDRFALTRPEQEADPTGLLALPPSLALAIEMALHEEQERRALDGELSELERAWHDAERIAAIADDLTLPQTVIDRLARLKRG